MSDTASNAVILPIHELKNRLKRLEWTRPVPLRPRLNQQVVWSPDQNPLLKVCQEFAWSYPRQVPKGTWSVWDIQSFAGLVNTFIHRGYDLNQSRLRGGHGALSLVAGAHIDLARVLLERGASLNLPPLDQGPVTPTSPPQQPDEQFGIFALDFFRALPARWSQQKGYVDAFMTLAEEYGQDWQMEVDTRGTLLPDAMRSHFDGESSLQREMLGKLEFRIARLSKASLESALPKATVPARRGFL